jgi:hypothetical protein
MQRVNSASQRKWIEITLMQTANNGHEVAPALATQPSRMFPKAPIEGYVLSVSPAQIEVINNVR